MLLDLIYTSWKSREKVCKGCIVLSDCSQTKGVSDEYFLPNAELEASAI